MKTKKLIITAVALMLVAGMLAGCSPASEFVPNDTTRPTVAPPLPDIDDDDAIKSFVVRTENYYFDSGEYYYFFSTFLQKFISGLTKEQLTQLDLDIDTSKGESLKDRNHPDGMSWYDYFRDISLEYMTKILLVCEVAVAENGYYINDAQAYYKNQVQGSLSVPVSDFVAAYYGAQLTESEYANAIQKEYIYNRYCSEKSAKLAEDLTDADIETFASSADFGEKDTSLARNALLLTVERGSSAFNEDEANRILADFLKGEKTADALKALADAESLEWELAENITRSDGSTGSTWLYAEGRAVGDTGVIKSGGADDPRRVIIFYCGEGKPMYYLTARDGLVKSRLADWLAGLKTAHTVSTNSEKLNGLKA